MRRLPSLLILCALAGSAPLAAAQDSAPRILRIVSASAERPQVGFRVQLERSGASAGPSLQLRSSAAVYQRDDHLEIVTPAEFLITTEGPFTASFSTASANETMRIVVPTDEQTLEITGARVVLARDKEGAPLHLHAVEHGTVRSTPRPPAQH